MHKGKVRRGGDPLGRFSPTCFGLRDAIHKQTLGEKLQNQSLLRWEQEKGQQRKTGRENICNYHQVPVKIQSGLTQAVSLVQTPESRSSGASHASWQRLAPRGKLGSTNGAQVAAKLRWVQEPTLGRRGGSVEQSRAQGLGEAQWKTSTACPADCSPELGRLVLREPGHVDPAPPPSLHSTASPQSHTSPLRKAHGSSGSCTLYHRQPAAWPAGKASGP